MKNKIWKDAKKEQPATSRSVIIAIKIGNELHHHAIGYYIEEGWFANGGMPMSVTHWCEIPEYEEWNETKN